MNRTFETLVEGAAASLRYYPESKIVHQELKRSVCGDELRTVLEKGLEAFVAHGASKWLSDDRRNGPLTPLDADWILNDWTPRIMNAGWRFWAVVWPTTAHAQTSMRRWIAAYAKKTLTAQAFHSPAPALDWLEHPEIRWSMSFWHDAMHDVVTMTFQDCILETPEDATDFMRVVFTHIQQHKTPADVLIDYSGLVVKPAAARQFGIERAEFGRRFVRRSYRFNVRTTVSRIAIYTSSVLEGAQTNVYGSREEALATLLAQRAKEPLPGDPKR